MDYLALEKRLQGLGDEYKIKIIGQSEFNRNIYAVEKCNDCGFFTAVLVASVHAREWITTELLLEFIKENLFKKITHFNISLILMANPDGVELSINGLANFSENEKEKLVEINNGRLDFSLWKANAMGVDINNNFDAGFALYSSSDVPSSQGYAGKFAESEKETKAIINYIKNINPFIVISYHTKGEEIYYNYFQNEEDLERDKIIAEKFAITTGYAIKNVETVSSGGLKDYVVEKMKLPSLTIECGNDDLSHPIRVLGDIYLRNKNIANDLEFAYNVFIKSKEK